MINCWVGQKDECYLLTRKKKKEDIIANASSLNRFDE
jgi:hypothetical protein